MPKKGTCNAQPVKVPGGKWRIQITLLNGKRPRRFFDTKGEALEWRDDELKKQNHQHAPVLGGPGVATLAEALDHYARNFSVEKEGVEQELVRVNHYLEGAGMPLLGTEASTNGGLKVVEVSPKTLSKVFKTYVDRRRESSAGTFAWKKKLARMQCSKISHADIVAFKAQMVSDGLSDSTIQKEIALLKVFFNSVKLMNWKGLENPCIGVKLGKSRRRFVNLTEKQSEDLLSALSECDNPYFLPLVLTAKETTMRLDTLMSMTWANTSIERRNAFLPTKTGDRPFVLSREVQGILAGLPNDTQGRVFPLSKTAVNSLWDRVRIKAGLPELQFRDLRHLGATDWVRRGLNAHELKQVLGHDSIATAQFYIDLVGKDIQSALDKGSENAGVVVLPAEFPKDPKRFLNERRAARLNKRHSKLLGTPANIEDVPAAGSSESCAPELCEYTPAPSNAPKLDGHSKVEPTTTSENSSRVVYVDFRRKVA